MIQQSSISHTPHSSLHHEAGERRKSSSSQQRNAIRNPILFIPPQTFSDAYRTPAVRLLLPPLLRYLPTYLPIPTVRYLPRLSLGLEVTVPHPPSRRISGHFPFTYVPTLPHLTLRILLKAFQVHAHAHAHAPHAGRVPNNATGLIPCQ